MPNNLQSNICCRYLTINMELPMRFKLFLIAFSFISTATMAQYQVPPGVNADRYNLCMNEGLGKGRPYSTSDNFCMQWAGTYNTTIYPPLPPKPINQQCNPIYSNYYNCKQIGARALGPAVEFCKQANQAWVSSGCRAEIQRWNEEQSRFCKFNQIEPCNSLYWDAD